MTGGSLAPPTQSVRKLRYLLDMERHGNYVQRTLSVTDFFLSATNLQYETHSFKILPDDLGPEFYTLKNTLNPVGMKPAILGWRDGTVM